MTQPPFNRHRIALLAISAAAMAAASGGAQAAKTPGTYVAGDFHNHTTCSDGSISMQKLVKKSTDKTDTPWGLDWFVQAGHGGNGNRNCTLVEDASLATPAYPFVSGQGPTTTWAASIGSAAIKGNAAGPTAANMWRWQSIQEFQYPLMEYLSVVKNLPLFMGLESVVAGHEHTSMSVITGQMPVSLDSATMPTTPGGQSFATALGNATALAQWSYCFDRGDTDTSRGNTTATSGIGNNWTCEFPGGVNASSSDWNAAAQKLLPTGSGVGSGIGTRGHAKTVEAVKWMAALHPNGSYYVPAHLERAGPFNPDGNNGFNVEHLRNFNNAAPRVAFGMETQPGHGASSERGEYRPLRNGFTGSSTNVDSVGGTTYGGTGVYGAWVGGVWDALLGEGRNFWFFASSDWHNRGSFGADDRRSTQDFYPGEYQRNYTMVRNGSDKLRPQTIVDGLRTGNNWAASGQLIDRLAFVACVSYPGPGARTNAAVENLAVRAAANNTDIDVAGCVTMGEKLVVRPGADLIVAIAVRDPEGKNFSPYSFPNPSLKQIGVTQPLNEPVLDHIDVLGGNVTGYVDPNDRGNYAGEAGKPLTGTAGDPAATYQADAPATLNTSARKLKTFNKSNWTASSGGVLTMSYVVPAVKASQYFRLRGTNLPPATPYETDADGNPLMDYLVLPFDQTKPGTVPCTDAACPAHLRTINGVKYSGFDVAAWADLWFYANPVFIEVLNSVRVAGVR